MLGPVAPPPTCNPSEEILVGALHHYRHRARISASCYAKDLFTIRHRWARATLVLQSEGAHEGITIALDGYVGRHLDLDVAQYRDRLDQGHPVTNFCFAQIELHIAQYGQRAETPRQLPASLAFVTTQEGD